MNNFLIATIGAVIVTISITIAQEVRVYFAQVKCGKLISKAIADAEYYKAVGRVGSKDG